MTTRRFEALDGMRGIAALAVFGHHLAAARHQTLVFGHAYLAVDFFFMLSGFVIGAAYEERLAAGLRWTEYMGARLRRLYPMVVAGALIGLLAGAVLRLDVNLALAFALQLVYVPLVVGRGEAFPLNVAQWSLSVELAVNALHAAVLPWSSTRVLAALVALSAAGLVAVEAAQGDLNVGATVETLGMGGLRALFSYFAGVLIYRLYREGRLPRLKAPFWLAALALALALAAPRPPHAPDVLYVTLLFPLLVVTGLEAQPGRVLRPFAAWSGAVSYPLYAIHMPLVALAAAATPRDAAAGVRAAYWGLAVVAILLLAWAVQRFYDEPVRRGLRARAGAPVA